jgi:hypothetical protein
LNQAGLVEGNNFDRYTARLQNDYQLFKHLKVGYSVTGRGQVLQKMLLQQSSDNYTQQLQ